MPAPKVDYVGPEFHPFGRNIFRRFHYDGIVETVRVQARDRVKWEAALQGELSRPFHEGTYTLEEVLDAYGHAHPAYALLDAVVEYRAKHPNNAVITPTSMVGR